MKKLTRVTNEDGIIQNGCKNCRHSHDCDDVSSCRYEDGISSHYVFHLGKHKGESLEDVMRYDPQYLLWMMQNTPWFQLSQDVKDELIRMHEGYSQKVYAAEVERDAKYGRSETEQE